VKRATKADMRAALDPLFASAGSPELVDRYRHALLGPEPDPLVDELYALLEREQAGLPLNELARRVHRRRETVLAALHAGGPRFVASGTGRGSRWAVPLRRRQFGGPSAPPRVDSPSGVSLAARPPDDGRGPESEAVG
jgi:hypothetical protein